MTDTELLGHLVSRHPGIGLAQPYGMYPNGRPLADLRAAHNLDHRMDQANLDHRHGPPAVLRPLLSCAVIVRYWLEQVWRDPAARFVFFVAVAFLALIVALVTAYP